MYRRQEPERKPSPRDRTSIFSVLFFFFTAPIFIQGYKKIWEIEDLFKVVNCCESKKLADELEKRWYEDKKLNGQASLYRILWQWYGKTYILIGIIQFVWKTILTIWSPLILSRLISYFTPGQIEITYNDAIYYTTVLIAITLINIYYEYNFHFWSIELGFKFRNAICSLLYRKSLKLSPAAMAQTTMGKISTIITRDIDGMELIFEFTHNVWIGFVNVVIICCFIYYKIGKAAIAGVMCFLIVLPLQGLIGKCVYKYRLKSYKKCDERLELIQETLSSIKVIKMYVWEKYFMNKIHLARKKELIYLHKVFYSTIVASIAGEICNKISFFLFVVVYIWLGNHLTAELVYLMTYCFENLEFSLGDFIPWGISTIAGAIAAVERIESVLNAPEIPPIKQSFELTQQPHIIFKNVTTLLGETQIFENINLTIEKGLNILIGNVGSGKTTFLKTILQEYYTDGQLEVHGRISYASQEPWLFPASLRQNILFGEQYCEERYSQVLDLCALNYDLATFPDADNTIIIDRGLNLSKGQQARVNLARAIYRQSDIYLLDDSLASLDANVSDSIFDRCIKQFLKDKICIFTTNNFNYTKRADRILLVNKGIVKYTDNIEKENINLNSNNQMNEDDDIQSIIREEVQFKPIFSEKKNSGKVSPMVYLEYIRYGGTLITFTLILCCFLAYQSTVGYTQKVLSNWVTLEQNLTTYDMKNSSIYEEMSEQSTFYLKTYIFLIGLTVVLITLKTVVYFQFLKRISINIHKTLIQKIINSTMYIFDSILIGNILNRTSKDLMVMDEFLPFIVSGLLRTFFNVLSCIALLVIVQLQFLIGILCLFIFTFTLAYIYQPTGRNLNRLNSISRSPLIGHLNATLEGLTTIRASKAQNRVKEEYDIHQNLYMSASHTYIYSMRALSFFLELFGSLFISMVIIRFLIAPRDTAVGDVGLAMTQSFIIVHSITQGIGTFCHFENNMISTERILEYIKLPTENKNGLVLENWPNSGHIQFIDVSLKYIKKAENYILNNINFSIQQGQKLGIVGRTGAGKSSISSCIFRLYEFDGKILIDGIDIKTVSLDLLRSKITIIPQDPILFCGTIRDNFDPLNLYTDNEIWRVITELKLRSYIENLNIIVDKHNNNFSAGQKQLICLARAILKKNKIVILDEATANVDEETDILITDAVQNHFYYCSVIIIAHRLSSVLNCDNIMVLDRGEIVEFDKPHVLLQNENSFLQSVVK